MSEDYSKYTDQELMKLYEDSMRLAQTYHISQLVKKVLLNSLYGALGNNHFLLYTHEMARGITLMGRCLIRKAAFAKNEYISKILKEKEVKDRLIYGDTDSCVGETTLSIDGKEMTISDFYEIAQGKEERKEEKSVKKLIPDTYYTKAISDEATISTEIKYVMKHKVKKHFWKVKVDGKEVIITDNHSLMFQRDGILQKGTVHDLREGDILLTIS